jgi:hypothetical protein
MNFWTKHYLKIGVATVSALIGIACGSFVATVGKPIIGIPMMVTGIIFITYMVIEVMKSLAQQRHERATIASWREMMKDIERHEEK